MSPFGQFLSALVLTYFVSRLLRRLRLPQGRSPSLTLAHGLSLGLVALFVVAVRLPLGSFRPIVLAYLVIAQFLWFVIDGLRRDMGQIRRD